MGESKVHVDLGGEDKYYKKVPIKLGCAVYGIDLKTEDRPEVISQIKRDVSEHRLLVFKDQGIISGERHVEIGKWFGEPDWATFYKHPKSPHPDVFRVSNDKAEGCVGAGRTGWHIDGSFQPAPFAYSLYHMVSVPKLGPTAFAPLTEIIEGLSKEKRNEWDRIWIDSHWDSLYDQSTRETKPIHPLVYAHPITKKKVLCFHLGIVGRLIWDFGSPTERVASRDEFERIIEGINEEIVKNNRKIQYIHHWEPGEFIISDNLAVAHEATQETQLPRSIVGLRVLHRVTIAGTEPPKK